MKSIFLFALGVGFAYASWHAISSSVPLISTAPPLPQTTLAAHPKEKEQSTAFTTFALPRSILSDLSNGNATSLCHYVYFTKKTNVTPALIRFMTAAWKTAAPTGTKLWLSLPYDKTDETAAMQLYLCCFADLVTVKEQLLLGDGSIHGSKWDSIFSTVKLCDPQWLSRHQLTIRVKHPQSPLYDTLPSATSTDASALKNIAAIIASPTFRNTGGKVLPLLKAALQTEESLLIGQSEVLRKLVELSSTDKSGVDSTGNSHKTAVNYARMLFNGDTTNTSGKNQLAPLKLAALLCSNLGSSMDLENILHDIYAYAATGPETGANFLQASATFKNSGNIGRESLQQASNFLGESLSSIDLKSPVAKGQIAIIHEALSASAIKEGQHNATILSIISSAALVINASNIEQFPESWQKPAVTTTLTNIAKTGNAKDFLSNAKQLSPYYSGEDLFGIAAQNNQLSCFSENSQDFAALLTDSSLPIGTVTKHLNASTGGFIINHPELIAGGNSSIQSAFQNWASTNPYDCSSFLDSLPATPQRSVAIQGLIASLSQYDPAAAKVWQDTLNAGAPP